MESHDNIKKINFRVSAEVRKILKRRAVEEERSQEEIAGDALTRYLTEAASAPPAELQTVESWTPVEHALADAFIEWLRDPDPREEPYRKATVGIVEGFRKRRLDALREAKEHARPSPAGVKEGGPSSDGQTDPVSKRPRRLRHGG